ncbi:hypothetical protein [Myxococcus virescens]|uniref:Lipoprotein n=1 Tax=Myxococcus virescens TaxID=83456 RepID=A0A511HCK8_9BACT|nr:hypothetical protein [Myxococcus virescens]GEL71286.1 hypothetical protein MVI01_30700 [Myxococcus virescens]SDE10284.1 putative lipoprotein [Myxococcus virescens]
MRLHALLPSLLLLVLLAPLGARAASGDAWLGPDKPKHFAACFMFAGAGYAGGALLFDNPHARWLTGAGLAMGAGVGKELYDLGRGTTFSMKDLAWDAVGAASGLAVSYVVDRLVFRRDDTPSEVARQARLRRPVALRLHVAGDGGLPGGLATRMAFDELYQLLSMQPRVHRHQGAAAAGVAGDEHGDLAARALVHAAGGAHADLFPQAAFGERALEPARQVQSSGTRAALHQALPADEHLHVLHRSTIVAVPHPSSIVSSMPLDAPRARP